MGFDEILTEGGEQESPTPLKPPPELSSKVFPLPSVEKDGFFTMEQAESDNTF
jgi:hypothetical protein